VLDLPLHPIVVHFPLALLALAWLCLVIHYVRGTDVWSQRAGLLEAAGVVALLPTIVAGFVDTRGFGFMLHPRWDAPLIWHSIGGLTSTAVFVGHYLWRRRLPELPPTGGLAVVDLGLVTVGFWLLVLTGTIAGEMVYVT
jgi:uncharacterized membrane protein